MVHSNSRVKRNAGATRPQPLMRDSDGRIIKPPRSQIRSAILAELGRRQMSRYQLWKTARKYCPTLTQSAVYEFLRGIRQLGLAYIEALLATQDIRLVIMSDALKHRS